ncbi:hypothetical protein GQ53DRAFT_366882 [Thozetella sp. PMI_491]|nr:hypothetical protein GQ53DRAFT_366882 [Thozetella sp. PMI_491]
MNSLSVRGHLNGRENEEKSTASALRRVPAVYYSLPSHKAATVARAAHHSRRSRDEAPGRLGPTCMLAGDKGTKQTGNEGGVPTQKSGLCTPSSSPLGTVFAFLDTLQSPAIFRSCLPSRFLSLGLPPAAFSPLPVSESGVPGVPPCWVRYGASPCRFFGRGGRTGAPTRVLGLARSKLCSADVTSQCVMQLMTRCSYIGTYISAPSHQPASARHPHFCRRGEEVGEIRCQGGPVDTWALPPRVRRRIAE